ncbi:MAG: ZIP family metal transporter [Myxococcaceae bacterium]
MSSVGSLALYSALIVLGAVVGGLVPLFTGRGTQLVGFLAFAAGVLFGAAFFHMLPEAVHEGGYSALSFVPLGFLLLFFLERYVLVHACEEPPDCAEHGHGSPLGLTAFLGMSVHTLFDGVALGSAVLENVGLTAFVAIVAHKIPSSLSLAAILRSEGRSRMNILVYVALFGLMVPLGAGLYFGLDAVLKFRALAAKSLAFSAGTFLYIAVSDLLPHVNRHGKNGRLKNIVLLGVGLLAMFLLSKITGQAH